MLHAPRLLGLALGALVSSAALLGSTDALAQPSTAAPPAVASPAASAATVRLAIIDSRRVITETEEGLRVQAALRKLFDAKQADLASKERQLQQEWDDLLKEEKQKGRSAGLDQRKAEWKQKYLGYQQTTYDIQKEFSRKESELYNPMLQKVTAIVKALATKDGLDVVLEKQAAPYFRVDLDITEKVIQQYNASEAAPAKEKSAKPAK
jgi:outer membrane protein